jgi:hypothetical protein
MDVLTAEILEGIQKIAGIIADINALKMKKEGWAAEKKALNY